MKSFSLTFIAFLISSSFCLKEDISYPGIQECSTPGLVALTFDDGPSPNGGTQNVLNVLREEGVKATFFVTGRGHDKTWLDSDERKQSLLRQIFAEGHQIGSHTWLHSNLIIQNQTTGHLFHEMAHLAATVRSILGINMTVLRPPYGYTNDTVVKFIEKEFGYQVIRWNLDTKDWFHRNNITASLKVYEDTLDSTMSSSSSFITLRLHHDPVPKSGDLARKAIRLVRSKGFRLVTVGECIMVYQIINEKMLG